MKREMQHVSLKNSPLSGSSVRVSVTWCSLLYSLSSSISLKGSTTTLTKYSPLARFSLNCPLNTKTSPSACTRSTLTTSSMLSST